jgi:hypothetical protein
MKRISIDYGNSRSHDLQSSQGTNNTILSILS